ncbi:circularly permuted type 2 ATP-grasp protein [Nocardia sp. NPDC005978]|uniref:circularly permuted type 2 ATP-grasp protein n=1 Tax=Nocardia sp. NPDC005978 TaxID=3156725 RepID=UPI0033AEDACB
MLDATPPGDAGSGRPDRWGTAGMSPAAAEQYAKYRAAAANTGAFDACGLPTDGYHDELVDGRGRLRPPWAELAGDLLDQGGAGLDRLDARVRRLIEDDGITYTELGGSATEPAAAKPWRLDPIPLLLTAPDWAGLEAGVVQRSRLLDAILADVYGPRRTITSGLLPPQIVFGYSGYMRAAHGITLPGRHQLFLHACDISRWSDGGFRVLADWAQAPSGAGYALADRRVVSAAIPEAFELASPLPLTPFVRAMRLMLIEAAPRAADEEPTVVVLSPGPHSETAFDQAYLASVLGFPLVENADLVVRDGRLWMRSLGTLEQVDVVLRRVDAEFSDPLDLRPDSRLGVVGLVEVLRRGAVTVVNTLGSGVLETPALAAFLPRLSRMLLDQDLKLPSVETYWGGDDLQRSYLIGNLHRLILRSTRDGTTVFGALLTREQRARWRARIEAEGWKWVGQEPARFSLAPAVAGGGTLAASPVEMRLFSLAGRVGYRVMAGGLGQLHQRTGPDGMVGEAAAKDIWVRATPTPVPAVEVAEEREHRTPAVAALEVVSSPRVLSDLFWLGRYGERAEATVRLLSATHDRHQDYRYRPWMEGADAMPILIAALGHMTGTAPPAPKQSVAQSDWLNQQLQTSSLRQGGTGQRQGPGGQSQGADAEPAAGQGYSPVGEHARDALPQWRSEQSQSPDGQSEPRGGQSRSQSGRTQDQGGSSQSQSQGGQSQDQGGQSQSQGGQSQSQGSQSQSQGGQSQSQGSQSQSQGGQSQSQGSQSQSQGGQSQSQGGQSQSQGGQSQSQGGQSQSQGAQSQSAGGTGSGSAAGGPDPGVAARREQRRREFSDQPTMPIALPGASRSDHDYLVALTVDRELPGSVAYAMERYGKAARAVRDQLSPDTWMVLGSVDRALAEYRGARGDQGAALSAVHSRALAGLLSLAGIDGESMVRDTGWRVMDIGRRIERGLALCSLLAAALTDTYPAPVGRVVTEAVLRATVSSVSYRRRHRDSVRVAALAALLLFDASNPRSLAYQLARLEAHFLALPAAAGSARPQRLLSDAQRMLHRLDPADLEVIDAQGCRTELAELLDGVHLRLRKVSESFESTRLSVPRETQPLWGSARVVG